MSGREDVIGEDKQRYQLPGRSRTRQQNELKLMRNLQKLFMKVESNVERKPECRAKEIQDLSMNIYTLHGCV